MKPWTIAVMVVLLAVVAASFWVRDNVDGLVKEAIHRQASAMTGARVKLGAVKISAADGRGELLDLAIGNPPGFKTPHALTVARVAVELELDSLAKDVVVVKRIAVIEPNMIYEKGEAMTNIDAIQKNIAAYLGPSDAGKAGKKLIVGEFSLTGAKAEASAAFMNGNTVTVPLPDILLKDIGRNKGGVTPGEFGQIVAAAMKQKLSGAYSFDRAVKATGEVLNKAGEAIKGLFK